LFGGSELVFEFGHPNPGNRIQSCRLNAHLLLERDQMHEVGYLSEATVSGSELQ